MDDALTTTRGLWDKRSFRPPPSTDFSVSIATRTLPDSLARRIDDLAEAATEELVRTRRFMHSQPEPSGEERSGYSSRQFHWVLSVNVSIVLYVRVEVCIWVARRGRSAWRRELVS